MALKLRLGSMKIVLEADLKQGSSLGRSPRPNPPALAVYLFLSWAFSSPFLRSWGALKNKLQAQTVMNSQENRRERYPAAMIDGARDMC